MNQKHTVVKKFKNDIALEAFYADKVMEMFGLSLSHGRTRELMSLLRGYGEDLQQGVRKQEGLDVLRWPGLGLCEN